MSKTPIRVVKTFRYAILFDSMSYVVVKDIDLTEFTVEVVFYLIDAGWSLPIWRPVLSKGWFYDTAGVGGLYILDPRYIGFFVRTATGSVRSIEVSVGLFHVWRHVVCMYKPGDMAIYVDGKLMGRASVPEELVVTNDLPWEVGRDPIQTARLIPRSMYYVVRMYSRLLTSDEVQYNFTHIDNPIHDGLKLYLLAHPDCVKDIDGDGVLEWVDLSGNNNHGKIYGARLVELVRQPVRVLARAR
jgi:hypothetical protein